MMVSAEGFKSRLRRGSSLLETVISLFLMAAILILSFQLFHNASAWQGESESRSTALWLARAKLEESKIAAKDLSEFQNSLHSLQGVSSDPQHPSFTIEVTTTEYGAQAHPGYSPSRTHEELYNSSPQHGYFPSLTDDRRSFGNSTLNVTVKVAWSQDRGRPIVLNALVREPARTAASIEITQTGPNTLNFRDSVEFSAHLLDNAGLRIEDATIHWSLVPVSSYGLIFQTRQGNRAILRYADTDVNNLEFQPPPGACRLKAAAKIEGVKVEKMTNLIVLGS